MSELLNHFSLVFMSLNSLRRYAHHFTHILADAPASFGGAGPATAGRNGQSAIAAFEAKIAQMNLQKAHLDEREMALNGQKMLLEKKAEELMLKAEELQQAWLDVEEMKLELDMQR